MRLTLRRASLPVIYPKFWRRNVFTVRMKTHWMQQQQRVRNVFKLTTIFSAASQILSTLASDNPLIPVRFYIKPKDSKQSRLIQSMIHPIRIQWRTLQCYTSSIYTFLVCIMRPLQVWIPASCSFFTSPAFIPWAITGTRKQKFTRSYQIQIYTWP